jgi:hypothetical protein
MILHPSLVSLQKQATVLVSVKFIVIVRLHTISNDHILVALPVLLDPD